MTLFQGLMVLGGIALLIIIVVGFVKGDSVKPEVSRRRSWRRFVELSAVRDKRSSEGSSGSHPAVGHRLREVRRTSDNVR